jgi:hypothetical protein
LKISALRFLAVVYTTSSSASLEIYQFIFATRLRILIKAGSQKLLSIITESAFKKQKPALLRVKN